MKIYRLRYDVIGFDWFDVPESQVPVDCIEIADLPLPALQSLELERPMENPLADFSAVNLSRFPAVGPTAAEFLQSLLADSEVVLIPLSGKAQGRWLAQVILTSDCLDANQTVFRSSGLPAFYEFDDGIVESLPAPMFRLPDRVGGEILVTDRFVTAYFDQELYGLRFDELS